MMKRIQNYVGDAAKQDSWYRRLSLILAVAACTVYGAADAVVLEVYFTDNNILARTTDLDGDDPWTTPTGAATDISGFDVDSANGKVYWIDNDSDEIRRSDLDGSNQETIVSGLGAPNDVALDLVNGKIYWTDDGTDKVQRANLDGSFAQDVADSGDGLSFPAFIDVDGAGGKVYWGDFDTFELFRSDLDGSNVEVLYTGGGPLAGVALDSTGGKVYWSDLGTGSILRADLDGSNVEDALPEAEEDSPFGIAFDEATNRLYWAEFGFTSIRASNILIGDEFNPIPNVVLNDDAVWVKFDAATNRLYWQEVGFPDIQSIDLPELEFVTTGFIDPTDSILGLALDFSAAKGTGDRIYYAHGNTNTFDDTTISRIDTDGTNQVDLTTNTTAPTIFLDVALDLTNGHIYYTDTVADTINRANLDGSDVTVIHSLPASSFPAGIALDVGNNKVYWTENGSGDIHRSELNGLSLETLVSGQDSPFAIAVDPIGQKIYWNQDALFGLDPSPAKVQRANLDGSNVEDVVPNAPNSHGTLAVDPFDEKLYWSDGAGLHRSDLDGSNVEDLIGTGFDGAIGIALNIESPIQISGTITSDPPANRIIEGHPLTLAAPAGGTNYQWQKNGVDIPGAVNQTLAFNPVTLDDAGAYTVTYDDGLKAIVQTFPFEVTVIPLSALPIGSAVMLGLMLVAIATLAAWGLRNVWQR